MDRPVRVLFVCLGNICRSPTAHGVFLKRVVDAGLADQIEVDSCGTGGWHVGEKPDRRATAAAARRGYQLDSLRARQLTLEDFGFYDYILPMDRSNMADIHGLSSGLSESDIKQDQVVRLFLSFAADEFDEVEVPDPYYGGDQGFEHVLDLIESAATGLLADIQARM